jgi:radical SAM protein with 4Fe4S-binding SPASM domain
VKLGTITPDGGGDVYSYDHYVYPEYRLGNMRERSLSEMVFDPVQVKFGYAKSEALPAYCRQCEFLRDCWGECPKNRVLRTPDGEPGPLGGREVGGEEPVGRRGAQGLSGPHRLAGPSPHPLPP